MILKLQHTAVIILVALACCFREVSTFLLDEHRLAPIAACMAAVVLGAFALFIRQATQAHPIC